ncbi:MAG: hypothetical protein M0006_13665 [Magnetospirillum sp.]|nr:hypothetical protein [Magnetospirillum sp.]
MSDRIRLSSIVFLDVEASGLGERGYPIEVGFVRAADLTAWAALVRPTRRWRETGQWDRVAEGLHGIGENRLDQEGVGVMDVARALNGQLAGKMVFTDAPDFDRHWLGLLFEEAFDTPEFELFPADTLLKHGSRAVEADVPVPAAAQDETRTTLRRHRAKDDALALALAFLGALGRR